MNGTTQKGVLALLVVAIVGVVGYVFWQMAQASDLSDENANDDKVVCAMDARQCADGSYVSRVPPTCQFAECPNSNSPTLKSETIETRINVGATALDVKVVPTALVEDSRCPSDVQCIQAGTVRVRALLTSGLGTGTQIFTLNQPITTEAEIVTLVEVRPLSKKANENIPASSYVFVFKIEKRTDL